MSDEDALGFIEADYRSAHAGRTPRNGARMIRTRVARRYQRAIRIDTDLGNPAALEGFICPRSSAEVLETMARHVAENGQGAFTWTGPYGGGKSSLAVVP